MAELERQHHPDLTLTSPILFWDTDNCEIKCLRQYRAVIQRVFDGGNDQEKEEILKFYRSEKIKEVTGSSSIIGNRTPIMTA
ncbi:MAG TPA: hypothetical protein VL053_20030 [Arachidicoccus sp.]|nr:hypothetical protein [Arachidicoccus sp.]